MPHTTNMVGTSFWGCAEPRIDGSYITTEWITVGIPIIPLKSHRLRFLSEDNIPFYERKTKYEVLQELDKINTKQVWYIYKWVALYLVVFAIILYFFIIKMAIFDDNWIGWIIGIVIDLVAYIIFTHLANRVTIQRR